MLPGLFPRNTWDGEHNVNTNWCNADLQKRRGILKILHCKISEWCAERLKGLIDLRGVVERWRNPHVKVLRESRDGVKDDRVRSHDEIFDLMRV